MQFLLGLPPVLGLGTEARVRERVTELDGYGVVAVKVKSFDRGWFGSTARIELAPAPGYLAKIGLGSAAAAAAADELLPMSPPPDGTSSSEKSSSAPLCA